MPEIDHLCVYVYVLCLPKDLEVLLWRRWRGVY
jgi:hypothetical protein